MVADNLKISELSNLSSDFCHLPSAICHLVARHLKPSLIERRLENV